LQRGLFGFQLGDVVGQALQLTGFIVTELVAPALSTGSSVAITPTSISCMIV
jgi:hypothetical protein